MATARKLPSGNWRCRVYSHTDASGKKIYESFTASTKTQAESMATKFTNNNDRNRAKDLTVKEAVQSYLEDNEGVLSPTTLKGYKSDFKRMKPIYNVRIRKISSKDVQRLITTLLDEGKAPKTIKNTYTTLTSALRACDLEAEFNVNLPEIPEKDIYAPEDEQIVELFLSANPTMKKVIIMACHSMRLSEICGATYGDFEGNIFYLRRVKVDSNNGGYAIKAPKTKKSKRYIRFTDSEMKIIGQGLPDEPVIPITPRTVDGNFARLRKKVGLNDIILHDLRTYYASISIALEIPQNYIEKGGGWKSNSTVLRKHYEMKIKSFEDEYTKRFNDHVSGLFDTNKKAST